VITYITTASAGNGHGNTPSAGNGHGNTQSAGNGYGIHHLLEMVMAYRYTLVTSLLA